MDLAAAVWLVRTVLAVLSKQHFPSHNSKAMLPTVWRAHVWPRHGKEEAPPCEETRVRVHHTARRARKKNQQRKAGWGRPKVHPACVWPLQRGSWFSHGSREPSVRLNTARTDCWCWLEYLYTYSMLAESNMINSACIAQYLSILL